MLALNLKMHLTKDEVIDFENYIYNKELIVMPQYPYIPFFQRGKYILGSQDVSKYKKGAYTGEVSAECLKSFGCEYAMVGHSERKQHFNESLEDCKEKLQNVIDNNMIPVYCVDQDLEDFEHDEELKNIELQLESIPDSVDYIIMVFEPSYIIGKTDMIPDTLNIEMVMTKIKEYLNNKNIKHKILYGGGVSKSNIDAIISIPPCDGAIICTKAFDKEELDYIYKVCVENKS